ncbi:MAG: PAS domain-containing sensor histidine kinase [Chitinophagaceae bacterium]
MRTETYSPLNSEYDFENAPCGYLVLCANGTILHLNQTMLRWLGYSREEIVNKKNLSDITPRGTSLYFQMFVYPSLKMQGYINEVSLDIIGFDNSTTSCLFNATAVRNEDGSIKHLNAILFGISDRKKYEEEILQEKKLAETMATSRELILQAQRRIMAILGHDTRAPLFSINRIIKLAIDGTIPPEDVFPHFELMANQLDATLILIDNLLNWANAHYDSDAGQQKPIPLRTVSNDVYQLLRSNAVSKKLFLNTQIDPSISVRSNQSIISFIVRNLVNNAIKFTSEGGVTVSAEHRGDLVNITISDTGMGMDADQVKKYTGGKLDSTAGTANEMGSGMGLMLIKEFLIQLKGELQVESEPGQGSSITVVLPDTLFEIS